jgi:hypothetical protein
MTPPVRTEGIEPPVGAVSAPPRRLMGMTEGHADALLEKPAVVRYSHHGGILLSLLRQLPGAR